jgi:branched-chain amino acid transport system permease protein
MRTQFKLTPRNILLALVLLAFVAFLVNAVLSDPQLFLKQVINGLSQGAVFALIALGYTMVYGIIELINFAHGDVYMVGAFIGLTIFGALHVTERSPQTLVLGSLALTFVLSIGLCAVLNVLIERSVYRPLRNAPRLAPLIAAIGVSFVLEQIGLLWASAPNPPFIYFGGSGAQPKPFPNLIPNINILTDVLGLNTTFIFSAKQLFAIGLAIPLMIALRVFVSRTTMGKAMRATAQNRDASRLMGINVDFVIAVTFLIGGALAGAGGIVGGLYFQSAQWNMGFDAGLKAFTAAVLGGIGNITGAMLGGFLIGLISALSDQYLATQWTRAVVFLILVLILVFRPNGLLGTAVTQKA